MRLFRNIFTYCVFVSSHSSKYYSTSISVKPKKQNCVEILPFQFAQKLAFKTRNISQRLSKKILYRNTDRETLFCVVNERCEKRKKICLFFPTYLLVAQNTYLNRSYKRKLKLFQCYEWKYTSMNWCINHLGVQSWVFGIRVERFLQAFHFTKKNSALVLKFIEKKKSEKKSKKKIRPQRE